MYRAGPGRANRNATGEVAALSPYPAGPFWWKLPHLGTAATANSNVSPAISGHVVKKTAPPPFALLYWKCT